MGILNPGQLWPTGGNGEVPRIPHIADGYLSLVIVEVSLPGAGQRPEIGQTYLTLGAFTPAGIQNGCLCQHKGNARHRYNGIHSRQTFIRIHNFLPCYPAQKSIGILNTHNACLD
jgi:hypothetical protein